MDIAAELAELRAQFREEPRVVVRGVGELVVAVGLFVLTFALLPQGVTDGNRVLWYLLVAVGAGFVLLPTFVDPVRAQGRQLTEENGT
jgi:hypothetical protein